MRTIEIILVIFILLGSFVTASQFAVLPSPRTLSGLDLSGLALTTLQSLNSRDDFGTLVFSSPSDLAWGELHRGLSSILPPNVVYRLCVYRINTTDDVVKYDLAHSISNYEGDFGMGSEGASCLVSSSNVTFNIAPQKVGERDGELRTLYILNCNDANGWWITGYSGQSLALEIYNLLSPYFQTTVLVNSTSELGLLLENSTQIEGNIQDAIVINTFGEAVPIPTEYCSEYQRYTWELGKKVNEYNWTWVSIVGYPLYYVSNTVTFASSQNGWGIYGMKQRGPTGFNAFLQGIDGQSYNPSGSSINGPPFIANLTSQAIYYCNYYGLYPSPYQMSTRSLPTWILSQYSLSVDDKYGYVFQEWNDWIAGATYNHIGSDDKTHGVLTALGLTRTPDIRITALALLTYYHPTLYKEEFTAEGTSRLVSLQLAQQGRA